MGTSQSRQDRITDSDSDYHYEEEEDDDVSRNSNFSRPYGASSDSSPSKLSASELKVTSRIKNAVKLYRHDTPKAEWNIISDKLTSYKFVKTSTVEGEESEESFWYLGIGSKIKLAVVEKDMRMKMFGEVKRRAEFVSSGVHSLALGALENSFLVNASGVQFYRNMERGIHGRGVCVRFDGGQLTTTTPNKDLLMRAETNMMLMSPSQQGKPHSSGVKQLDLESGKIVTEWRFEKDGTEITMRDITNDTKGSQVDPSESTFLGLDENRLCQWDMRERRGTVQNYDSAVLEWNLGHQFSRGTNFTCFASTGDGSVVVGSDDGKIRLYSKANSLGRAQTAFPGLGSPITHVDVSYDGKLILGTADTYLVLICALFTDKDGQTKTGFTGRMGNIPAPRLLKLTTLDSHLAGKDNKFHGAHFSWVTESGRQERHIVATVGKFSVIWDMEKVKNSAHECYRNQQGLKSCYCYKILLKDESIVESRFMHDRLSFSGNEKLPEAPLVVATPQKVSSISLSGRRL